MLRDRRALLSQILVVCFFSFQCGETTNEQRNVDGIENTRASKDQMERVQPEPQVSYNLARARNFLDSGKYDEAIAELSQVPATHALFTEAEELLAKAIQTKETALWHGRLLEARKHIEAERFEEAKEALDQFPEDHPDAAQAQKLLDKVNTYFEIRDKLRLSDFVKRESLLIENPSNIEINKGVVHSLNLTNGRLQLLNPSDNRVKPDFKILVLNRDGVILWEHEESWLWKSPDYEERYSVDAEVALKFPARELAFSRWARYGWDMTPHYLLCLGSKGGLDRLKAELRREWAHMREHPLELSVEFNIREQLPDALDFQKFVLLETPKSSLVKGLEFTEEKVRIHYINRTSMRIKPKIQGYIFNRDGVIIESFQDEWWLSSLHPAEEAVESKSLNYSIPEKLELSRWAGAIYDLEPRYVYLADSSKAFDELVSEAENRVRQLYSKKPTE